MSTFEDLAPLLCTEEQESTRRSLWVRSAAKIGAIAAGVALVLSPEVAHTVEEAVEINLKTAPTDPFSTGISGTWSYINGDVMRIPQKDTPSSPTPID